MNKIPIGASGQIKVTKQDNGNIVIDIDPTYKGQVSINTVGTIKEGDWQGNVISPTYGGTGFNNNDSSIELKGNVKITGSIIINCDDDTDVLLPKSGTIAIKENSLQIENALSEIIDVQKAYDHISPNSLNGDITYYNGENNEALALGEEEAYLKVKDGKPTWEKLPVYINYVGHGRTSYNNPVLHFETAPFVTIEDKIYISGLAINATTIKLHSHISSLSTIQGEGFLALNSQSKKIETRKLINGNGIEIENNNGAQNNSVINISPRYAGQNSINTLGVVKKGKWNAEIIAPEFGGTGTKNQHCIKLGGYIDTNCSFTITSPNHEVGVNFYAEFGSFLTLPETGTVATKEESLQSANNLHDVKNPQEAFRHLSPTKKRGDIIVRGYGDYDINIPIGEDSQVLTVNKEKPGYIEWQDLNLENRVTEIVNAMFAAKEKAEQEKLAKQAQTNASNLDLQECIHALFMQFDHMFKSGQIRPLKELQDVLIKWSNTILK